MDRTMIPEEKMARYRATARARARRRREALVQRRERGRMVARRGAALLKSEFGATRVAVFGSLTQDRSFHERSDIDLAAWDVPSADYLRAVGALLDLDSEFEVDLVRVEEARPSLRERIELEGVEL